MRHPNDRCVSVTSQQQRVFAPGDGCLAYSTDDLLINIAEN